MTTGEEEGEGGEEERLTDSGSCVSGRRRHEQRGPLDLGKLRGHEHWHLALHVDLLRGELGAQCTREHRDVGFGRAVLREQWRGGHAGRCSARERQRIRQEEEEGGERGKGDRS